MAKTPVRTKTAAAPAAQSREEAENLIGRIGDIQRELMRRQADLGDAVARIKAAAEETAEPLKAELLDAQERVQRWCEANRNELTRGGKVKFAELATGTVSWRARPASVTVRGLESVITYLLDQRGGRFVRIKHELDKDAMRNAAAEASMIPGVKIGSEGEDFVVKPFDAELAEAA